MRDKAYNVLIRAKYADLNVAFTSFGKERKGQLQLGVNSCGIFFVCQLLLPSLLFLCDVDIDLRTRLSCLIAELILFLGRLKERFGLENAPGGLNSTRRA